MLRQIIKAVLRFVIAMVILGCILVLLFLCMCGDPWPTRGGMNRKLADGGLSIPDSATDVRIYCMPGRDRTYFVRFHIPMAELDGVLGRMGFRSSTISTDRPTSGTLRVYLDMTVRSWWQPGSLQNVRYAEFNRHAKFGQADWYTDAIAGETDGTAIVYLIYGEI